MADNQSKTSVPKKALRVLVTAAVVVAGLVLVWIVFVRFVDRPWTRDGQVRADIISVAGEVPGKVVQVHVKDEELVEQGQLLFEIDPASYKIAVDQAKVALDEARQEVAALEAAVEAARAGVEVARNGIKTAEAQVESAKAALRLARVESTRYDRLSKSGAGSTENAQKTQASLREAQASLDVAETGVLQAQSKLASSIASRIQAEATLGVPGEENVRIRAAKVALSAAELDLTRTKVLAPRTGWVTNLFLQPGDYAQPGAGMITLVDKGSLRVSGFFKETQLHHIQPGDRAVITLMGRPDRPIKGIVENIGRAINPPQIATVESSSAIVPSVAPSYDWIRLAQRVPVRIRLEDVPDDIYLVSGATVSVAIRPAE